MDDRPRPPRAAGAPAHVVLLGLMGAGKTTVGRIVAGRTGRRFVDVDDRIRERTGRSVRELWEAGGEAAFRPLERDVVLEVLAGPGPDVLAAPGGSVLDPAVRDGLAAADAVIVWLRAPASVLAARVAGSTHRPLLGGDAEAALAALGPPREARYRELAHHVVDVADRSPADVATAVLAAVSAQPGGSAGSPGSPAS
jgi:shikimate kinase